MERENITETAGKSIGKKILKSQIIGIVIILLVMCLALVVSTEQFLVEDNIFSVLRQISFIAILAIGECLVIITGGIDLSVGSVFAMSSVVGAMSMAQWGVSVFMGIIIGLVVGAVFGLANGLFITKLRLPPFIATLGTLSIARGLAYGVTGGYPISSLPPAFKYIGQGYIGPVPFPVILLVFFAIVFTIFLKRTVLGRRIYAIGGNEESARVSGIKVQNIKLIVYTLSGVMASVAGMATAGRLGVAQSTAGQGYELDAIAAVIIGGASVTGGIGTVVGAIIGAAIMGVLKNGLVLLSVSAYWQQAIIGFVIILAVSMDQLRFIRKRQ